MGYSNPGHIQCVSMGYRNAGHIQCVSMGYRNAGHIQCVSMGYSNPGHIQYFIFVVVVVVIPKGVVKCKINLPTPLRPLRMNLLWLPE
jgi:hypothetical protein